MATLRHVERSGELRINTKLTPEPHFFLHDWAIDDDNFKLERTWRWLRAQDLGELTRALATGSSVNATVVHEQRTFHFEYAFENPQGERSPLGPAEQHLWFYPMNDDRMTFNVCARDAITALGKSVRWALRHLDDPGPTAASWRKQLEQAARDLDRAAWRCELPLP